MRVSRARPFPPSGVRSKAVMTMVIVCRPTGLRLQRDGDQRGGVFKRGHAMKNVRGQVQQMACAQHMAPAFGRYFERAFDALDRDVPRHLVRRQRPAFQEDQPHHLEVPGLEERLRLLSREAATQRPDVDGLTGEGVFDGHGVEYARGLGPASIGGVGFRGRQPTAISPSRVRPVSRSGTSRPSRHTIAAQNRNSGCVCYPRAPFLIA